LREFRAARRWLRERNPEAARRFADAVVSAARLLGDQPLVGPERPALAPPGVRMLVVRGFPYLLAYELDAGGQAVILRVLHAARDVPSLLRAGLADDER
jgi:toxin ParE1/3/4